MIDSNTNNTQPITTVPSTSEIKPFRENNNSLFPSQALHLPNPVNVDGTQEFFMEKMVDEWKHGRGKQYLVQWHREGPEGGIWLDAGELEGCEVLDEWLAQKAGHISKKKEVINKWLGPFKTI
jgi:hypothetical protein